jgi:hypothetical protein
VTLQTEPIEATLGADSDGGAHSDAGADAAVEATRREGVVLDVDAEGVQTNGAGG